MNVDPQVNNMERPSMFVNMRYVTRNKSQYLSNVFFYHNLLEEHVTIVTAEAHLMPDIAAGLHPLSSVHRLLTPHALLCLRGLQEMNKTVLISDINISYVKAFQFS